MLEFGSLASHLISWIPRGELVTGLVTSAITLCNLYRGKRDDYLI